MLNPYRIHHTVQERIFIGLVTSDRKLLFLRLCECATVWEEKLTLYEGKTLLDVNAPGGAGSAFSSWNFIGKSFN